MNNLVIGLGDHTVVLNVCIYSEAEDADTFVRDLLTTIGKSGHLLTKWNKTTNKMFPGFFHNIPDANQVTIDKLDGVFCHN